MLTRPEDGWATVAIGGEKLDVSYIEPVPQMLLTAFIRALSMSCVADVTFDAEGWRWRMESAEETRLTIMGRTLRSVTVPVSARQLAAEALADIRQDIDAWSNWLCHHQPERADDERAELLRLCKQLERLL